MQSKRGGDVWLLRETKYQPDQPKAGTRRVNSIRPTGHGDSGSTQRVQKLLPRRFVVTFSWLGASRTRNCKSGAFNMGYSLHIPVPRGTVKVKSESRLRPRERSGKVPTFRLFSTYFVWEPKASRSQQTKH